MKSLKFIANATLFFGVMFLISCSDDAPDPRVIKNTSLLAGKKGQSKSWMITSFVVKDGGSSQDIFDGIDVCFTDNIFTFNNSEDQEFQQTEGSTKCDGADPSLIESGSWYLTSDGLKISVIVFGDDVNNDNSAFFAYFPAPWSVKKLSSSALELEYVDDNAVIWTVTFVKA